MAKIPNPGSEAAINAGCSCPVLDNHKGKGFLRDGKTFIYVEGCKVHMFITKELKNASEKRRNN